MPTSTVPIERSRAPLIAFLDDVGDGTGNTDFALNFLVPTIFKRVIPAPVDFCITAIIVQFVGQGGITPDGFGGGAALPTGMSLQFIINGITLSIGPLDFIKTNNELSLITTLNFITEFSGNNKGYHAELDLEKLGVECVTLSGKTGDSIQVIFDDDYTTRISTGTIVIQGYFISNS